MNIIFCTQGESLNLFNSVLLNIKTKRKIKNVGFILSDSWHYENWKKEYPSFENLGYNLLKEWEVTKPKFDKPDLSKLETFENKIGNFAGLFGSIVADRRLFMGPNCTVRLDYNRRFSDEQLLCILQNGVENVEKLFQKVKPDFVLGFICVTFLDYIVYLMAKSKGVKFLNLRPTRVSDRVSLSSSINDPSTELINRYNTSSKKKKFNSYAQEYILRVKNDHAKYEGVVNPTKKPILTINRSKFKKFDFPLKIFNKVMEYKTSEARNDNHVYNPIKQFLYTAFFNPIRAKKNHLFLKNKYLELEYLKKIKNLFFPLHVEPEVSLLVYGRPYLNQIELIRMLSISMPANFILIVKEHPWMIGKRNTSFYKKILNIPRIRFVSPENSSRSIILNSDLITVITGSIALEAAILEKPVLTFGDCPYNLLPDKMLRRINDPRNLPFLIKNIINNYSFDEDALERYIMSVFETSISLNLYSMLLKKNNVYTESNREYHNEVNNFSEYILKKAAERNSNLPQKIW